MDITRIAKLLDDLGEIVFFLKVGNEPTFEYLSPGILSCLGFTEEEFYANPNLIFDLAHPQDKSEILKRFSPPFPPQQTFTFRWIHRFGHEVWLTINMRSRGENQDQVTQLEGIVHFSTQILSHLSELQNSEQKLLKILTNTPLVVVEITDTMDIVFASPTWWEVTGGDPISKPTLESLLNPPDFKTLRKILTTFSDSEPAESFDLKLKNQKGRFSTFQFTASPLGTRSEKSRNVLLIGIDISSRVELESALLRQQAFLDETGHFAKVGGWELDLENDQLLWTKEVYHIHELPLSFVPTVETAISFYVPEHVSIIAGAVDKLIKEGKPFDLDLQILTPDRRRKWVHAQGKPIWIDGKIQKIFGTFQDIQQKLDHEHKMNLLSTAMEEGQFGVIVTNLEGIIEYVNPYIQKITGYSPLEILGESPRIFKSGLTTQGFYNALWDTILSGSTWQGEFQNKKRDGSLYWDSSTIVPVKNFLGKISHFVCMKEDVTKLKATQEQLQTLATVDPLTGVFNRGTGLTILEKQMQLAWRNRKPLTISFIDIDNLKTVNDTLGHLEGDFLIKTICKTIQDRIRTTDTLVRLGGDEFLIILPECNEQNAFQLMSLMAKNLNPSKLDLKKPYEFSFSFGLHEYPGDAKMTSDIFIEIADEKMYEQKREKKKTRQGKV